MILRMAMLTALIALFGLSFSFVTNGGTKRAGSVFASETGESCSYEQGVVCPVQVDRKVY